MDKETPREEGMKDDVYERMLCAPVLDKDGKVVCMRHPIQEEWKPKFGDITVELGLLNANYGKEAKECLTYLPRQEQWQEKYQKYLERSINKNDNVWSILNKLFSYTDDHLYQYELSEHLTILWCLFVSKEVIWKQVGSGITFDWDKNVWRKIQ